MPVKPTKTFMMGRGVGGIPVFLIPCKSNFGSFILNLILQEQTSCVSQEIDERLDGLFDEPSQ